MRTLQVVRDKLRENSVANLQQDNTAEQAKHFPCLHDARSADRVLRWTQFFGQKMEDVPIAVEGE